MTHKIYQTAAAKQKAYRTRLKRRASAARDFGTPPEFFDELDREFHFTLDAAASDAHHLCENYYTIKQDGLAQPWSGVVWVNPPFNGVRSWFEKALAESKRGATTVILSPVYSYVPWFQEIVMMQYGGCVCEPCAVGVAFRWPRVELRFINKKLRFGGRAQHVTIMQPLLLTIFRSCKT
jgi:site-specific DNA-methyltransferase (adenine-specific)